ncbi:MAG: C-terminal target protein [Flavipsychrobacter sp.]|jgi:hypothetical protein|nr:C-terminal target protein [Flavipsychrobacter sp.]
MKKASLPAFLLVVLFTCSLSLHTLGQRTTGEAHISASIISVAPWHTMHDTTILVKGQPYDFEIESTSDVSGYTGFFLAPDVLPTDTAVNVLGTTGTVSSEGKHHILVENLSLAPGTYMLKLCRSSLAIEILDAWKVRVVSSVGVAGVNGAGVVNIYPNPATDVLNIAAGAKITNVTISNVLGQAVYTREGSAEKVTVDISSLPSGSYYVILKGHNEVTARHFIKS